MIFKDLIATKYPDKKEEYKDYLNKRNLNQLDVLKISELIRKHSSNAVYNLSQKHKAYNQNTIQKILRYQKVYELNDSEVARHFKMSRNTIKKWKDLRLDKN